MSRPEDEVINGTARREVHIKAPAFRVAIFEIKGNAPLVIHRFSAKTAQEFKLKNGWNIAALALMGLIGLIVMAAF